MATLARDDPCLVLHPDDEPKFNRHVFMHVWFDWQRRVSDTYVNLPWWRMVCDFQELWPEREL